MVANAEYIPHACLDQFYINIIDAALIPFKFQVYHHVDGRVLDSAVAPKNINMAT